MTRIFAYLRGGVDDFVCLWCLQLKTRQGTELLIQSENEALVNEWYRALQDTISTHVRMNTFTESLNVLWSSGAGLGWEKVAQSEPKNLHSRLQSSAIFWVWCELFY